MIGLGNFALALLQLPGVKTPNMTAGQWLVTTWNQGGWMMWPLGACAVGGVVIIVWKLISLGMIGARTRKVLQEVDARLSERDISGALAAARESNTPAGRIVTAGLERADEGTERVMKAIENVGLIQMAQLERGLIWLATLSNVAPLLGFLGTVIGMIEAFQAIEVAGEVEATLVAGGIKVALITTMAGLTIAIPINVAHNYFVTRIDRLVLDMEETAQKMVDTLHDIQVSH